MLLIEGWPCPNIRKKTNETMDSEMTWSQTTAEVKPEDSVPFEEDATRKRKRGTSRRKAIARDVFHVFNVFPALT
jgi:hypothetical protein